MSFKLVIDKVAQGQTAGENYLLTRARDYMGIVSFIVFTLKVITLNTLILRAYLLPSTLLKTPSLQSVLDV